MRASKRCLRGGRGAVLGMVMLVSCGRVVDADPPEATGGASPGGTGGASTGGTGGASAGGASRGGASTGGTSAGGASTGGTSAGGASTGGASRGGASTGGASTGGTGGTSTGGTSTGTDGSVDVCQLYGAPCCGPPIAAVSAGPGASCVLDVLSAGVDTTYQYADLEEKVAALPPDVLLSVTDADIAWAAAEPAPNSRLEMHLTPRASSLHGATLETAWSRAFRLSCGGQSLFVGVVYYVGGAAALRTPVLHVSRDPDGTVVLRLGAWQGAWWGGGGGDSEAQARARIDRPELRSALCQRGALRELDADGGNAP